jgi:hypothetical protein
MPVSRRLEHVVLKFDGKKEHKCIDHKASSLKSYNYDSMDNVSTSTVEFVFDVVDTTCSFLLQ